MALKQKVSVAGKTKLSTVLHSWLPILKMEMVELQSHIEERLKENPFAEVSKISKKRSPSSRPLMNANSDAIESMNSYTQSLYEKLQEQIDSALFPTPKSKEIAQIIIEELDNNGYFVGDMKALSQKNDISINEFDRIRQRFKYLEPVGVAAINLQESLIFQLDDLDIENELYEISFKLIENFDNLNKFIDDPLYNNALKIIKKLKNPPAIDYFEKSETIIPEAFVLEENGEITVKLNDYYYPEIIIDEKKDNTQYAKKMFKEARDLIDAVEMRKHTLYSLVMMLIEYQYDFFKGGPIKPLKLEDIADELDRSISTISRASSNKYIVSKRGIIPIKDFFSKNVGNGIAQAEVKIFLKECIDNEDKEKPLADKMILKMINDKYKLNLCEKAINKYRRAMEIPSSRKRKGMIK